MPALGALIGLIPSLAPVVARLLRLITVVGARRAGFPVYVPPATVSQGEKAWYREVLRKLGGSVAKGAREMVTETLERWLKESPGAVAALYLVLPAFAYLAWLDMELRRTSTFDEGYITPDGFSSALDALLDTVGFLLMADVISGADVGSDIAEELVSEVAQKAVSDFVEMALRIKAGGMEPDVDEVRETLAEGALQRVDEVAMQYLATGLNVFSAAAHAYSAFMQGFAPSSMLVRERVQQTLDTVNSVTWTMLAVEALKRAREDAIDTLYRFLDLIEVVARKAQDIVERLIEAKISSVVAGRELPYDDIDAALGVLEQVAADVWVLSTSVNPCEYIATQTLDEAWNDVVAVWRANVLTPLTSLLQSKRTEIETDMQGITNLMRAVRKSQ